jgi:3-methyladenine DNA glycosylase AlkC
MPEPLKLMYNSKFFEDVCPLIKEVVPGFPERPFIYFVFDNEWPDLELKQRTRRITNALGQFLPKNYPKAVEYVKALSRLLLTKCKGQSTYPYIFLPDFIEVFGMDHFDVSMRGLEETTKLVSAEFAIRPFIMKYPQTMKVMRRWSKHSDPAVRRLSSEGCRPRLPWGMALPQFKDNPSPIIPILENLKSDPSESVRRSVANNLNDIAKDNPDIALTIAKKWKGSCPETDWIIKHGCRTLLKQGDVNVLNLHGYNHRSKAEVMDFDVDKTVKVGQHLSFHFYFVSHENHESRFRLEYAIDYKTATGRISRKIFKVAENSFEPEVKVFISRKKSFEDFATRKHFRGEHVIRILVNSVEKARREFLVI